jgi:hypothetical protein
MRAFHSKVVTPRIDSGMKKADQSSREPIARCDVRSFAPIARKTRQRQVFQGSLSSMLDSLNMIYFVG